MRHLEDGLSTSHLVPLADIHSVGELILLQSLLEGSGIVFVIRHAHIGSLYPGLPGLSSHVLVSEQDRSRAEQLLYRLRLDVRDVSEEDEVEGC